MKQGKQLFLRLVLMATILAAWWLVLDASFPPAVNLAITIGGVLLTYPLIWLGRNILDRHRSNDHAVITTTFVHFGLGFTFGIPICLALVTYQGWPDWKLPVPPVIGLVLILLTGAALLLTMVNLALKGFGAPFFIALSQRLASDWLYAHTRNPMVLAALAFLISLGIWFQSLIFVLWVILIFSPALLFFVKVFEERELEFRFGESYLEYKSRTPMLFPGKVRKKKVQGTSAADRWFS